MTNRQRMQAAIAGDPVDRLLAVFRLDAWYRANRQAGTLPPEIQSLTLEQVEDHLGLGRSARGARVFEARFKGSVEYRQRSQGEAVITEWSAGGETLRRVQRYGPGDQAAGFTATTVEYPIKTAGDLAIYEKIVGDLEFIPAYRGYLEYDQGIGESGLPMVILGTNPFHDLLLQWTGYEQGFLFLYDHLDAVLSAVAAAQEAHRRMWRVVADSPAEFCLYGANFDTATTPPPLFREFFLPDLTEFNRLMHSAGKRVAIHADGDMSGLLDLAVEAGYDVADCFACAPMVRCTMQEARQAWKDRITIWGGVPSFMLEESFPSGKLTEHLEQLCAAVGAGHRFILGLADQAMPTASWPRITRVCRWAGEHLSGLAAGRGRLA